MNGSGLMGADKGRAFHEKKAFQGKKQHITAFYMEMLMLIAVFAIVILILTKVFAMARQEGASAEILTSSVCLAENTAEIIAACDSEETLLALLGNAGNVSVLEGEECRIFRAVYDKDRNPASEGSFLVDIEWMPEDGGEGSLVKCIINVYRSGDEIPVYTLETGVFLH